MNAQQEKAQKELVVLCAEIMSRMLSAETTKGFGVLDRLEMARHINALLEKVKP